MAEEPRPALVARLESIASSVRQRDLAMVTKAGLGHLGGDFSAADILATLYGHVLNISAHTIDDPDRDRFVLSKGHVAGALYCTLAAVGLLDTADLDSFLQPLSKLNGHPNRRKVPGIETNTGPLGHGFPIAVGIAAGAQLQRRTFRTYALCGDGELQEGSMWEAAMYASQRRLSNLTLVVDRNRLQQGAGTEVTNGLDPLDEKFRAFGWHVSVVDGHNIAQLLDTLAPDSTRDVPHCVIANTIKGRGVSFMENNAAWHHKIPTPQEFIDAQAELSARI